MRRPPVLLFVGALLQRCDEYVTDHAKRHDVDESHNQVHVLHYAKEIMRKRGATPYDILLTSLGSMLHDVPDNKYISCQDGRVLRDALDTVLPSSLYDTVGADLLTIIPHLSFSKTVSLDTSTGNLVFSLPEALRDFPHLESYHAVRQADLLSSYNTKRTLLYRMHKSGHQKSQPEVLDEARGLYGERMARLRSSNVFTFPEVRYDLAPPLEAASKRHPHPFRRGRRC